MREIHMMRNRKMTALERDTVKRLAKQGKKADAEVLRRGLNRTARMAGIWDICWSIRAAAAADKGLKVRTATLGNGGVLIVGSDEFTVTAMRNRHMANAYAVIAARFSALRLPPAMIQDGEAALEEIDDEYAAIAASNESMRLYTGTRYRWACDEAAAKSAIAARAAADLYAAETEAEERADRADERAAKAVALKDRMLDAMRKVGR